LRSFLILSLVGTGLDELRLLGRDALSMLHAEIDDRRSAKGSLDLGLSALFSDTWVKALEDLEGRGRIGRNMLDGPGADDFALGLEDLFAFE
jgi:hypothetical protein